jgi:excisionase family DNA binding protein
MALVSVATAAKELGVSRGTLYALARQRAIPCVKIGDRVLLNLEKVIAALEVGVGSEPGTLVVQSKGTRKAVEK